MTPILLVTIIIFVELVTHKSVLEMVTWVFKKIWVGVEWVILHLTRMNEPKGSKS